MTIKISQYISMYAMDDVSQTLSRYPRARYLKIKSSLDR